MANPLHPNELFGHVEDSTSFHLPRAFTSHDDHGHIELPQPLAPDEPLFEMHTGNALLDDTIKPLDLRLTKFMVLEVIIALIICVLFIVLAMRIKGGKVPKGKLWNLLEVFLLYIRNQIARPCIGDHDADRFVPFLWTMFFFVLGCNLMGMIPWMGSPTGALATTGALALTTFLVVCGSSIKQFGFFGFLKAQVPHMDLPKPIAIGLVPLIFVIEILGLFIKHCVLAVRLLANMMAGHVVLSVVMAFIAASAVAGQAIWGGVTAASVLGATALSLLELFVAFLQAYIFTFLSALFIGAAVHPH
jgi:F-type H+-transporting ATPase subunit a